MDLDAPVRDFLGRLGAGAPVGLAALDRDLRFLAVNEHLAEMNGATVERHLGRTLAEVVPVVAPEVAPHVDEVFATGEPQLGIEFRRPHPVTGVMRWAEASYFPIVDDGNIIAVGCAVLDTTDRINALRRLLLLQEAASAIASAPEPLTAVRQVAERALAAVGAQGAAAAVVADDGEALEVVAAVGRLGETMLENYPRMPISAAAPATAAFAAREVVWVPTLAEWRQKYPDGMRIVEHGAQAALVVPLEHARSNRCFGVLGLLWDHEPDLTPGDLALVATFGKQATEGLERTVLLDSERRARERFELLAQLGDRLDAEIGVEPRVAAFLDVVVPQFADFALVDIQSGPQHPEPALYARHVDPAKEPLLRRFRQMRRGAATPTSLTGVITTGRPKLLTSTVLPDPSGADPEAVEIAATLASESTALFPLGARGGVFGGVAFGRESGRPPFSETDFTFAAEISRRLATTLENARLYERERHIAETLQHSLLPDHVPDVPGLRCWPRYLPGTDLAVGGDFWDVLPLPGGRVLLAVGDVAGRGDRAAITMGRLRTVLRAAARQERSPATLAAALNRFMLEDEQEMATCVCAVLDTADQTLRIASAGHLPILRVDGGGTAELVGGATGLPLGVRAFATYDEDIVRVAPGDTLVLFTDGLVERRDAAIDDRLDQLVRVATQAVRDDGDAWCDRVVDEMIGAERGDDVAVLGIRLASGPQTFFTRVPAELGRLRELRDHVRAWLAANGVDHESVEALCLALGEATANVAMHAYGPAGGELRVRGDIEGDVVHLHIEDDGHWRAPLDDLGRGMRIIEQLADEVRVHAGMGGTTVELVRKFTPR